MAFVNRILPQETRFIEANDLHLYDDGKFIQTTSVYFDLIDLEGMKTSISSKQNPWKWRTRSETGLTGE